MTKPAEALEQAQLALLKAQERIAQLEADRAAKLEGDTYLSETSAIDQDIGRTRQSITVHRERIEAMRCKLEAHEAANREANRKSAIAGVLRKLPRRLTAGKRLESLKREMAVALRELDLADEAIFADWPPALGPVAAGPVSAHGEPRAA